MHQLKTLHIFIFVSITISYFRKKLKNCKGRTSSINTQRFEYKTLIKENIFMYIFMNGNNLYEVW